MLIWLGKMKYKNIAIGTVLAVATSNFAYAADLEVSDIGGLSAVSGFNGKIEATYVNYDFDTALIFDSADGYKVVGAVTAPLGERFGLQIDAGLQQTQANFALGPGGIDIDSRGVGAHLFWRRPETGLLGLYAHYSKHDFNGAPLDVENIRYGIEGEWYLSNWTFKGFVGGDQIEFTGLGKENFFTGKAEVGYYFNENVLATLGVSRTFDQTVGTVGFEAMWDRGEISPTFFANASFGEDSRTVMAGLRVYFGQSAKSLMSRHREDDPEIGLFDNFNQLGNCANATLAQAPAPDTRERARSLAPRSTIVPKTRCSPADNSPVVILD